MRYEAVPIYPNVFGKYGVRDKRTGCFVKDGIFKGKGCEGKAERLAGIKNQEDERTRPRSKKPDFSESGNIFFMLFGAVALIGVVTSATSHLVMGPLASTVRINNSVKTDTQINTAARMVLQLAAKAPVDACSTSAGGAKQPLAPVACAHSAAGGGCLPSTGGPAFDPWGTPYSYCAWEQGAVDPTQCPGLLKGERPAGGVLIAVISAGPDRQFQTTCADGPDYAAKHGDDIAEIYSPAESAQVAGTTVFTELHDAPNSYAGQAGKTVTVNPSADGLQFSQPLFTALGDAPTSYSSAALRFVRVNGTATGLQFAMPSIFDLTEMSTQTFSGHSGDVVRVDSTGTNLLFSSLRFRELADVPASYSGKGGMVLRVNPAESSIEFDPYKFTLLADGPGDFAGMSGKVVRVAPDETHLEYGDAARTFLQLADTPDSYVGSSLMAVRVNSAGTGLEFVSGSVANQGTMAFTGLTDAPSSYVGSALKAVRVNSGGSGLEFYTPVTTMAFTSLTDVPSSYSGQAGRIVTVNSTGTGLQFVTLNSAASGGALNLDDLGDAITNYSGPGDFFLGSLVGASSTGTGNTAIGVMAFQSATSAANNTFIGYKAGQKAQNAANNTAIGYLAMPNVTSGGSGGGNTVVGASAGGAIIGGSLATLIGASADVDNAGSNFATAIGYQAKAGSYSVAVGGFALKGLAGTGAGQANTALGYNAGTLVSTGTNNTILGAAVGSTVLTTGSRNILIGTSSTVTTPTATTSDYLNIGNLVTGTLGSGLVAISGSGALTVPAGTTSQRPAPIAGMIRYNSDDGNFEGFQNGAWLPFSSGGGAAVAAGSTGEIQFNSGGVLAASSNLVYAGAGVGVNTSAPRVSLDILGVDAVMVPAGLSSARPGAGVVANGMLRYNTSLGNFEGYQAGAWLPFSSSQGVKVFTGLSDVPNSYTGKAGKFVRVGGSENGLVFSSAQLSELGGDLGVNQLNGGVGASTSTFWRGDNTWSSIPFIGLSDVPASYAGQVGKIVRVNSAGSGLEFVSAATATQGTMAFTGLTDAPHSYSGQAGNFVRVNAGGSGLEFASAPSSGGAGPLQAWYRVDWTTSSYTSVYSNITGLSQNASYLMVPQGTYVFEITGGGSINWGAYLVPTGTICDTSNQIASGSSLLFSVPASGRFCLLLISFSGSATGSIKINKVL